MFSSALKSFSSNINSHYEKISTAPTSTAGPWSIYDAKHKSTGNAVSLFIFERKSLESQGGSLGRASASSLKKVRDEVTERLKKEAMSLARLRHPQVLLLVEPVEDTKGGLQFVAERVTASLSGLLQEKDDQERGSGVGGRSSRFVTEDSEGGRRRRELEIDELEIQKGLLQISKALEFLHDNCGLIHCNLTPDAIYINGKSDWKLGGMSFSSPFDDSKPTSVAPINLSEALNINPQIPRSVQMNLDFCSPDLVLDLNLNPSADMYSFGLLIIQLFTSPHASPLKTNSSVSTYKRIFASPSTTPSPSNNFLCSRPLPKELLLTLTRLITRRPAERMTAKEFQESPFFENMLIATIRFLDALPAKTPNEKAQFMRGFRAQIPSFPKSVLERKILPTLLEELKDRELLSLILKNVFVITAILPSGKRPFTEQILPRLGEIFLPPARDPTKAPPERDPAKEAGLMVLLEHIKEISVWVSRKEFHDDILPIIYLAIESPTHSLVDASLRCLPVLLPVMDHLTLKNELFPVVASVFVKTSSLGIKVRGLEAFLILCGGSGDPTTTSNDGLDGVLNSNPKKSLSNVLDKYTMQEKIIPILRAIKTKEPAVALATLNVLRQVGGIVDVDFVATELIPLLWQTSLGPLLNLSQFQSFMEVIKSCSTRVEMEHSQKLQELSGSSQVQDDFMSFGVPHNAFPSSNGAESGDIDFESLVKGKAGMGSPSTVGAPTQRSSTPSFSWSSPSPTTQAPNTSLNSVAAMRQQQGPISRTVTPDLSRFDALKPSKTQFSQPLQPLQPQQANYSQPQQSHLQSSFPPPNQAQQKYAPQPFQAPPTSNYQTNPSTNWPTSPPSNPWATSPPPINPSLANIGSSMSSLSMNQQRPVMNVQQSSSFSLPPPPSVGAFKPPPSQQQQSFPAAFGQGPAQKKSGLDAYESLI